MELFFALSGFLIGQRLIVLAGRERPWAGVPRFLAARWLRTLPMYYAAFLYPDLLAMFGRWGIVPMTAVVFAAGGATYWLIEAPVMRLRPRSAPVSA